MKLCKVRFDGNHHLVCPYTNMSDYSDEDIINKTKEDLGLNDFETKRDLFVNEWAEENYSYKGKHKEKDYCDLEIKNIYNYIKNDYNKRDDVVNALYEGLSSEYEYIIKYGINDNVECLKLKNDIIECIQRQADNLKARKQLFKRKALNNDWNYFVTFTYDDKKHNEETFIKTLKKKLQNYHTNYGWLYMGCFERSKTDRLHFHGLLYVPIGKMRGNIIETVSYDTNAKKKTITFINDEFDKKIGRNDFKPITKADLTFTHSLDYILKYIGKSNEKIVYSRGIKDDVMALVDFDNNVICKVNDSSPYYVLADTNMIEVSKDLNSICKLN